MDLLKGDLKKLSRRQEQREAFEDLEHRFISAPILCQFYPDLNTVVEIDFSDYVLGWILL